MIDATLFADQAYASESATRSYVPCIDMQFDPAELSATKQILSSLKY